MFTVGGIAVESLKVLLETWSKKGEEYTSPDKKVSITIYGNVKISDNCSLGNGCLLGNGCSLGNVCSLGYDCSLGDNYKKPISPLWFSGPRYSIGYYSPGMVKSGCITKSIKWWEKNIRRCAEENDYTPVEIDEYEWRIKILAEWMKRHKVYGNKES